MKIFTVIKISETTTRDSFLISKKQMFTHQPSMTDVYALINDLKKYALKNNCKQVNVPMLNILADSNKYRVMVALPINKANNNTATHFFYKNDQRQFHDNNCTGRVDERTECAAANATIL
jgi:hypothetical protein